MTDNSTQWIQQGLMVDIARTNLAALYTFDQRYFGDNLMFDDYSWENMQYLTIEQTIADIATFIDFVRRSLGTPSAPVILWGSQLGATLAAFTRLKYPHLVNGVWSSSGIYEIYYYTSAYYNLVGYTLAQSSMECRYRVQYAFEEIEDMIANNSPALQYALNLCEQVDATSVSEVAMMLERLIEMITSYIDQFHFHGVQNFCHAINNPSLTPLESVIRWARFAYESEYECFDFGYNNTVERYSDTQLSRFSWFYLQCTQAGIFRVTDQFNWLSTRIDFGYHLNLCRDVLGDQYNSLNFMNAVYDLQLHFSEIYSLISNIVYTNGYIDPWLYDGVTQANAENATVINIEYYSRSADLSSINGWDSYDLTLAKRRIREIITDWSSPT
ncbi:putative serine protease K12H4.7 isoform X2 [Bradysia coprophila]|nr:putative serine protease K12H4.7 isoform X2 [Bradysia coprophila]